MSNPQSSNDPTLSVPILKTARQYSLPTLFVLVVGSSFTFIVQETTKRTLEARFEHYGKELVLRMERFSRLKETILIDRYKLLCELSDELEQVGSDVNRYISGMPVEGFIVNGDIPRLTRLFERIASNKFLLGQRFHEILVGEAQLLLHITNARDEDQLASLRAKYAELRENFDAEMERVFAIEDTTTAGLSP